MDNPSVWDGFRVMGQAFLLMPPAFHISIITMFAALCGSFINVCIWRIPRGESIVWPRSRCTSCGHVLDAIDLLPIVTYLATRGHCRHCRAPVSARYVTVEIINVSLWLLAYFAWGGLGLPFAVTAAALSTTLATIGIVRMKGEMARQARSNDPRGGFTFISVMLACFLLAVSVSPFMDMTRQAFLGSTKNSEYIRGWALAQEKIEELHTLPFHQIVGDRKIYIETASISENIFADEFFGEYSRMREDAKYFNTHFTDVYTTDKHLPDASMEKFKRAYKRHWGTDYEPYPQGFEMFRRTLVVEDVKDKNDPKLEMKKAIVTVEINSKATKGRQLVLEAVFTNR